MDDVLLEHLEALAVQAASAAGRFIVDERPGTVSVAATKSSPTDVVTAMDTGAEDLLREMMHRERPHDAVFGEERHHAAGESGLTWVLDPIDGTVNYLYGIPQFAVSVAVVTGDPTRVGVWHPVVGAVAHPSASVVYHARVGGGAWRRGMEEATTRLHHAIAGLGYSSYDDFMRAAAAAELAGFRAASRIAERATVADLGAFHTVEEDRHGHGRHLLVGDVATGVRVDEPGDLLSRQHALVPLGADEVDDVEWFYGHDGSNR